MYDARPIPESTVKSTPKTSSSMGGELEKNSITPEMTIIIPISCANVGFSLRKIALSTNNEYR